MVATNYCVYRRPYIYRRFVSCSVAQVQASQYHATSRQTVYDVKKC